jgi:hypothetical protein
MAGQTRPSVLRWPDEPKAAKPRCATDRIAVASTGLARDLWPASCTPHDKTDPEANDSHEGDDGTDSVAVVDGGEHRNPDREQGETPEEPEGDEALPAIRLQALATGHGTGQSPRRR